MEKPLSEAYCSLSDGAKSWRAFQSTSLTNYYEVHNCTALQITTFRPLDFSLCYGLVVLPSAYKYC